MIESLFGTSFQVRVAQKNVDMPVQPECVPNQQVARKIKLAVDYPSVVIHQNLWKMRRFVTRVVVYAMLVSVQFQYVKSITWSRVPVLLKLNFVTCVASKRGCALQQADCEQRYGSTIELLFCNILGLIWFSSGLMP